MHPLTDEYTAPMLRAVASPSDPPDADLQSVFRFAVRHGRVDITDAAAIDLSDERLIAAANALEHDHLLRPAADGSSTGWTAVDPRIAAAVQAGPLEREIVRRKAQIARFADRADRFQADFTASAADDDAGARRVTGSTQVAGALRLALSGAQSEVFIGHGGAHGSTDFSVLLEQAGELLCRGVTVRLLCQHRSRADLTVKAKLVELVGAGAEVRTLAQLPRMAVTVDRRCAVLLAPQDQPAAGTLTDDGGTVAFVLDLFEAMWQSATTVEANADAGYAETAGDLQRALVGLMASGLTDDVIARKLSISVRSCRRHIAALLSDLGAVSRFQAGMNAANRRELVDVG